MGGSRLIDLPAELLTTEFFSRESFEVSLQGMKSMTLTCKSLYSLFQPALNKLALNQLIIYIANNNYRMINKMLKNNLDLLFQETNKPVIDQFDRQIKTPFEAVLIADDEKILSLIQNYLDNLPAKKQALLTIKIFRHRENITYNFDTIVEAIKKEKNIETELEKFSADFKSIIKYTKRFLVKFLTDACKTAIENYHQWNGNQASLFWCKVIGHLQFYLPNFYIETHAATKETAQQLGLNCAIIWRGGLGRYVARSPMKWELAEYHTNLIEIYRNKELQLIKLENELNTFIEDRQKSSPNKP